MFKAPSGADSSDEKAPIQRPSQVRFRNTFSSPVSMPPLLVKKPRKAPHCKRCGLPMKGHTRINNRWTCTVTTPTPPPSRLDSETRDTSESDRDDGVDDDGRLAKATIVKPLTPLSLPRAKRTVVLDGFDQSPTTHRGTLRSTKNATTTIRLDHVGQRDVSAPTSSSSDSRVSRHQPSRYDEEEFAVARQGTQHAGKNARVIHVRRDEHQLVGALADTRRLHSTGQTDDDVPLIKKEIRGNPSSAEEENVNNLDGLNLPLSKATYTVGNPAESYFHHNPVNGDVSLPGPLVHERLKASTSIATDVCSRQNIGVQTALAEPDIDMKAIIMQMQKMLELLSVVRSNMALASQPPPPPLNREGEFFRLVLAAVIGGFVTAYLPYFLIMLGKIILIPPTPPVPDGA